MVLSKRGMSPIERASYIFTMHAAWAMGHRNRMIGIAAHIDIGSATLQPTRVVELPYVMRMLFSSRQLSVPSPIPSKRCFVGIAQWD